MMHEPRSERFDPASILQSVWQHDYPPAWHIFYENERVTNKSGRYIFCLVLLALGFAFFICSFISNLNIAIAEGFSSTSIIILATALFFVVILGISGFLIIRLLDKENRKTSQQRPISTVVVMADGVVAHRHDRTKSLVFADIAHLRLRVQENTQTITTFKTVANSDGSTTTWPVPITTPAPAAIWFDVKLSNGRRTTWPIDFAPKDLIAQYILDAYMAYHPKQG